MWDFTSLLSSIYESKIATSMYSHMESTLYGDRTVQNSTRRAFDSRMESDAATYRVASQNMNDAKYMVEVAQSGTTATKVNLNDMFEVASDAAALSSMSDEQAASFKNSLLGLADVAAGTAKSISYNGMNLLDGSAGMNKDGIVVLQGGDSQINQDFANLLDSSVTGVLSTSNSNMNLNNLKTEIENTDFTDQAQLDTLVTNLESYVQRLEGIESNYSYDIKGLENLSILYENKAGILEDTIQYKEAETEANPQAILGADYLDDLLASSSSNGSIFNTSS